MFGWGFHHKAAIFDINGVHTMECVGTSITYNLGYIRSVRALVTLYWQCFKCLSNMVGWGICHSTTKLSLNGGMGWKLHHYDPWCVQKSQNIEQLYQCVHMHWQHFKC